MAFILDIVNFAIFQKPQGTSIVIIHWECISFGVSANTKFSKYNIKSKPSTVENKNGYLIGEKNPGVLSGNKISHLLLLTFY